MVAAPNRIISNSRKWLTNDVSKNKIVIRRKLRSSPRLNTKDKSRCIGSLSTNKTNAISAKSSKIKGRRMPRQLKLLQRGIISATIIDRLVHMAKNLAQAISRQSTVRAKLIKITTRDGTHTVIRKFFHSIINFL